MGLFYQALERELESALEDDLRFLADAKVFGDAPTIAFAQSLVDAAALRLDNLRASMRTPMIKSTRPVERATAIIHRNKAVQ